MSDRSRRLARPNHVVDRDVALYKTVVLGDGVVGHADIRLDLQSGSPGPAGKLRGLNQIVVLVGPFG